MSKALLVVGFLLIGLNALADDTCRNTNWPVNSLEELESEELKKKFCMADSALRFYTDKKEPKAVNSCIKAKNLISSLLKNKHGTGVEDCENLFPELLQHVKEIQATPLENSPLLSQTLEYFSPVAEGEQEPTRLYCVCERWGRCRTGIADKIFIQLFKTPKVKMEIGITPHALRYYEGTSDSEYVYTKDGFSGTVAPTSFEPEIHDNYYTTFDLSYKWISGSITLDRRTLKLIWNNSYKTAHKCSVVGKSEFRKKLLNVTDNRGFRKALSQREKAKQKVIKRAQENKKYNAEKVKI